MKIKMIAAHDINLAIGYKNKLLWNIPEDLKHFKKETSNKVVVMGSNTYFSIGKPLPNRVNAVITSKSHLNDTFNDPFKTLNPDKLLAKENPRPDEYFRNKLFKNIDDVLDYYKNEEEIIVIGGESIYNQFLDIADELIITVVLDMFKADTYFPFYLDKFKETYRSDIMKSSKGNEYFFLKLEIK